MTDDLDEGIGVGDDDVTITAEGFKIHCSEKVQTDDYENAQTGLTVEGSIEGAELDGEVPHDVRARLLRVARSLQKDVQKAAENRRKLPDSEDWEPDWD